MKIRQGFVSNSSSTSFCLYGTVLEPEDMRKFCEKLGIEFDENYPIKSLADELDLSYHQEYQDSNSYVIGRNHAHMGLDQTRRQFEEEIENTLKQLDPTIKCTIYEGGWFNG